MRFVYPFLRTIEHSDLLIKVLALCVVINGSTFAQSQSRRTDSTLSKAPDNSSRRLNIVYVLTDQWRAAATGYAGDKNVRTPNLDRLAKDSLNFRNAVSVCPICTPYRAALMTGRYPTSTGMFLNDAYLPKSELCMAEILADADYSTAYIGKWHLDGHGRSIYIPPERRQGWQYWKAAECDHNYLHSHYYHGDSQSKRFWEGYDAYAQTEDAQQYLRAQASQSQPFILFVSYGAPHFPHHTAPEEFKKLYPPGSIDLPKNIPTSMQNNARRELQGYYAHCTAIDKCVGDLLGTLSETGLVENTIFVFTSDHGEMMGSHGSPPRSKQVAWSESSRVPFLMRIPSVGARIVSTPITTPDILPTLLGLVRIAIPNSIEGEDMSPMIRSERDMDRAALYMNVAPFGRFVPPELLQEYRAIKTNKYTYVRNLDGPWMLFDDQKDVYQEHNLVGTPGHSKLVQDLDKRLHKNLRLIGDDFQSASEYIEDWGYDVKPLSSVPYREIERLPQSPHRSGTITSSHQRE